ncbi:MAG: PH domain-containing protein [Clostridia bacterium]|nr:PH domain-containing protein [Clostridia bacterium]
MGNYVEKNLNVKETILKNAQLHPVQLVLAWVWGIVGCWLLFIPTITAIKKTITYLNTELSITDKRVIGKAGFVNSASLDAPLNKIQNVVVDSGLFGKIFNYGNIKIQTAGDAISFVGIKEADAFKKFLMNQIEEYENFKIRAQAEELAAAMSANK